MAYETMQDVLIDIEKCGQIMGPLYYAFTKWWEGKATHRAFAAMRGGYPILQAARIATANKFANVQCEPLWINRDVSEKLHTLSAREYIEKNKLNKEPFTLLDTGYRGTISCNLKNNGAEVQALLISSVYESTHEGFFNETLGKDISEFEVHALEKIFEKLPCKFRDFDARDIGDTSKLIWENPNMLEAEKSFYKGFTQGVLDSARYQKTPNKKQLIAHYLTLEKNKTVIADTCELLRRLRFDNSGKIVNCDSIYASKEQQAGFTNAHRKIEKLYE